jgi:phosphoribosylaminoimidazole carboxylase (NCAIR synthetase)
MDDKTIGIVGGGQLMQMLSASAQALGMKVACLSPDGTRSPLGQVCKWTLEGSCSDIAAIKELSLISDIVTAEHESVAYDALAEIEHEGLTLQPSTATLRITQDKFTQKVHVKQLGIPVAKHTKISRNSIAQAIDKLGLPLVLKRRRQSQHIGTGLPWPQEEGVIGCDDHGFILAHSAEEILRSFGDESAEYEDCDEDGLYAEALVPYDKQLAVLVVRTHDGELFSYPTAHTLQLQSSSGNYAENLGRVYTWPRAVIAPAQISSTSDETAQRIAKEVVGSFRGVGVYAVEMFLMPNDEVLFHQVVPSVHVRFPLLSSRTVQSCPVLSSPVQSFPGSPFELCSYHLTSLCFRFLFLFFGVSDQRCFHPTGLRCITVRGAPTSHNRPARAAAHIHRPVFYHGEYNELGA